MSRTKKPIEIVMARDFRVFQIRTPDPTERSGYRYLGQYIGEIDQVSYVMHLNKLNFDDCEFTMLRQGQQPRSDIVSRKYESALHIASFDDLDRYHALYTGKPIPTAMKLILQRSRDLYMIVREGGNRWHWLERFESAQNLMQDYREKGYEVVCFYDDAEHALETDADWVVAKLCI